MRINTGTKVTVKKDELVTVILWIAGLGITGVVIYFLIEGFTPPPLKTPASTLVSNMGSPTKSAPNSTPPFNTTFDPSTGALPTTVQQATAVTLYPGATAAQTAAANALLYTSPVYFDPSTINTPSAPSNVDPNYQNILNELSVDNFESVNRVTNKWAC